MDAISANGMMSTYFCVNPVVCTPTRDWVITGSHALRARKN